jgi:hypothetical protein
MKINPGEVFDLRAQGWTLQRLADRYGCSKAAVSRYLKSPRVRFNKARLVQPCRCGCGRSTRPGRLYASPECYIAHTMTQAASGPYVVWRQGQRLARAVVQASGFVLQPGNVVHHADRDSTHNEVNNLWVFASHREHMSYHRGGTGRPIWRGDGQPLD